MYARCSSEVENKLLKMTIKVNNQSKTVVATTLQNLLAELDQVQEGIAVAINQNIVQKTNWESTSIQDGDDILIIQATQGG